MLLIFMVGGAKAEISFCIRSAIPGNIVVPRVNTVLAYRSFRMSTSHFIMELYVVSCTPALHACTLSIPIKAGWKRVLVASESFISHCHHLSIWKLIRLFQTT